VCEPRGNAHEFAEKVLRSGIASAARAHENGTVDLDLAIGNDASSAMRAVLEIAPMRSVALRRMNLDDVFVELVGASNDLAAGSSTGARIDA
jgi:hypothetical protein